MKLIRSSESMNPCSVHKWHETPEWKKINGGRFQGQSALLCENDITF